MFGINGLCAYVCLCVCSLLSFYNRLKKNPTILVITNDKRKNTKTYKVLKFL